MTRSVVVVDTETTGLDPDRHDACEVGWVTLGGVGSGWFVPPHSTRRADPDALRINRYFERIAGVPIDLTYTGARQLHTALIGNTLAGSNPTFDAEFLEMVFADAGLTPTAPWHHRLLDLAAYAAGVLGIHPGELEGLDKVAARLGLPVDPERSHTAYGDAVLTARCFNELRVRALSHQGAAA